MPDLHPGEEVVFEGHPSWRGLLSFYLGGIAAARGMEMYLPLWVAMMGAQGSAMFNVRVVTSG